MKITPYYFIEVNGTSFFSYEDNYDPTYRSLIVRAYVYPNEFINNHISDHRYISIYSYNNNNTFIYNKLKCLKEIIWDEENIHKRFLRLSFIENENLFKYYNSLFYKKENFDITWNYIMESFDLFNALGDRVMSHEPEFFEYVWEQQRLVEYFDKNLNLISFINNYYMYPLFECYNIICNNNN